MRGFGLNPWIASDRQGGWETASLAFCLRRNYPYNYVIQVHRLMTRTQGDQDYFRRD